MESLIVNNRMSAKGLKMIALACIAALIFVFALQYFGSKADLIGNSIFGETSGKVETWTEQTFWDKFWGNGFFQTRTKYTATPYSKNTTREYSNRTFLNSQYNGSSINQSIQYTKSETFGHKVTATITAKAKHIEAAVGYEFSYATTTSTTITANVAPYVLLEVWQYDVKVLEQTVNVKTQKQTASWWGWRNTGNPKTTSEMIREFRGCHIEYIETKI